MGLLAARLLFFVVGGATGVLGLLAAGVPERASCLGLWLEGSAVAGRGSSGLLNVLFGRTGAEDRLPLVLEFNGLLVVNPPAAGFAGTCVEVALVGEIVGPADDGRAAGGCLFARLRAMVSLMDGRVGTAEVLRESAAASSPSAAATEEVSGKGLFASLRRRDCCFFSSDNKILVDESASIHRARQ